MHVSEESNENEIQSFNIALFPEDKTFIANCITFAQNNFSLEADGYLLGNNAWPHITLCQFQTKLIYLKEIWASLANVQPHSVNINFDHFYIRPGRDQHLDKYWVGIAVFCEEQLLLLQSAVHNTITQLELESENSPNGYFPHLTCARCTNKKIPIVSSLPPEDFWLNPHSFNLSIGQSNKDGVYSKKLFPATSP